MNSIIYVPYFAHLPYFFSFISSAYTGTADGGSCLCITQQDDEYCMLEVSLLPLKTGVLAVCTCLYYMVGPNIVVHTYL